MNKKKLEKRMGLLALFMFVMHFLATKFYWYYSIFMFDKFMHFWGGFFILLLVAYIFSPKNTSTKSIILLIFGVFVVGVGWELFEVVFNNIIAGQIFDLGDTLGDLAFDVFGACIGSVYLIKRIMSLPTSNV